MKTLWLRLRAPFAAFRYFQAGVYRATAPTMPHSAAWGVALNLAGVEIRAKIDSPITEIDPSAPPLEIAVGNVEMPERCVLYQQLHSYPVGNSSQHLAPGTKGAKYHIVPVKREMLVDLDMMLGIRSEDTNLLDDIAAGITGSLAKQRYGIPFAGDNNLLFDRIDLLDDPVAAHWYTKLSAKDKPRKGSCRLTTKIDRKDSSRTQNELFAPTLTKENKPPDQAWVWVPNSPN